MPSYIGFPPLALMCETFEQHSALQFVSLDPHYFVTNCKWPRNTKHRNRNDPRKILEPQQSSRLNNDATYHAFKKSCPLVGAVSQIKK